MEHAAVPSCSYVAVRVSLFRYSEHFAARSITCSISTALGGQQPAAMILLAVSLSCFPVDLSQLLRKHCEHCRNHAGNHEAMDCATEHDMASPTTFAPTT